jgi:hypothetical protein
MTSRFHRRLQQHAHPSQSRLGLKLGPSVRERPERIGDTLLKQRTGLLPVGTSIRVSSEDSRRDLNLYPTASIG